MHINYYNNIINIMNSEGFDAVLEATIKRVDSKFIKTINDVLKKSNKSLYFKINYKNEKYPHEFILVKDEKITAFAHNSNFLEIATDMYIAKN